ncbi:DpnI domain-containing protein [Clostridium sp. DL1XJH146]
MDTDLQKYYSNYKNEYKSSAQLTRVISENWFNDNMYCPFCNSDRVKSYPNSYPVADFYCTNCGENFQLKAKKNKFGKLVVDGEYNTMINSIQKGKAPNFFFMNYTEDYANVINLIIVPKEFILPRIIQKRKPLSQSARRSGWTGCNILISEIAKEGKIFSVKDSKVINEKKVRDDVLYIDFIRKTKSITSRGWINDILSIVSQLNNEVFSLKDIYKFENILSMAHPKNNNIKAKIRQQLQILRDNGIIEFLGNGRYKKLS